MANFEIIMPKMGESIEEATITNWFVKEGDQVVEDDVLLEIATDKVDSEIPSPVAGVVKKILFKQDEVVAVGTVIAVIDTDGESSESGDTEPSATVSEESDDPAAPKEQPPVQEKKEEAVQASAVISTKDRFYSPLVRKIASEEHISQDELESIPGSGLNGRVQKKDILAYLDKRGEKKQPGPCGTGGRDRC
jgi:2-oxoglutarate dehydrogenase E2 component (dihydrolipoamide succinyltransferase)